MENKVQIFFFITIRCYLKISIIYSVPEIDGIVQID